MEMTTALMNVNSSNLPSTLVEETNRTLAFVKGGDLDSFALAHNVYRMSLSKQYENVKDAKGKPIALNKYLELVSGGEINSSRVNEKIVIGSLVDYDNATDTYSLNECLADEYGYFTYSQLTRVTGIFKGADTKEKRIERMNEFKEFTNIKTFTLSTDCKQLYRTKQSELTDASKLYQEKLKGNIIEGETKESAEEGEEENLVIAKYFLLKKSPKGDYTPIGKEVRTKDDCLSFIKQLGELEELIEIVKGDNIKVIVELKTRVEVFTLALQK